MDVHIVDRPEDAPNGFPRRQLNLKEGAFVVLMKNLSLFGGLCNGTKLQIVRLRNHYIVCRHLNPNNDQEEFCLPRIPFEYDVRQPHSNSKITHRRLQFPVELAFATTYNKAQGRQE